MGRKKQTPTAAASEAESLELTPPLPSEPAAVAATEEAEDQPKLFDAGIVPRLNPSKQSYIRIPVTEDGTADVESMTAAVRERYHKAIGASQIEPKAGWSREDVTVGYRILGALESFAAQKFWAVPQDIADTVCPFSEAEIDALAPSTAACLDKYVGEVKYRAEAELITTLVVLHAQKMQAVQAMLRERQKQKEQDAR